MQRSAIVVVAGRGKGCSELGKGQDPLRRAIAKAALVWLLPGMVYLRFFPKDSR